MTETDALVLGSGAAGLAAALTAAAGGAEVTVLEGSSLFGGTSAVSGGGMWPPGNLPDHRSIGPVTEGPFVGHRVRAGVFGTRGGPVINENAQIVGGNGRAA